MTDSVFHSNIWYIYLLKTFLLKTIIEYTKRIISQSNLYYLKSTSFRRRYNCNSRNSYIEGGLLNSHILQCLLSG